MPERVEGFYWVKYRGHVRIAEWSDYAWWFAGHDSAPAGPTITVLSDRLEPPKDKL